MSKNSSTVKKRNHKNHKLCQLILILSVFVSVTAALVLSVLHICHSDREISLYKGLMSADQNIHRTMAMQSTAAKLTKKQAEAFGFKVLDDRKVWNTETPIELFHTSCRNKSDEITVQSMNTQKSVAPGTEGDYTFSLQNSGKRNAQYKVWFEADSNFSNYEIPLEFRISGSNGWMDRRGKWLSAEEFSKISEKRKLCPGRNAEYTLYWRWRFERDKDEQDTLYGDFSAGTGNISVEQKNEPQEISYRVVVHTLASEEAGAEESADFVQAWSKNKGSVLKKAPKTGDSTQTGSWLIMLAASGMLAVVVICRRINSGILRRISRGLFWMILGISLYLMKVQDVSGSPMPMPFGIGVANVLSGSMEPTFSRGSLLIVRKTQKVDRGDIVVYQSGSSLVVHRVTEIRKDQIITQGDANNAPDPAFDRSEIQGVVIGWIPCLGTVLSMVCTLRGMLFFCTVIFLIEYFWQRRKNEEAQELNAVREEIRILRQEIGHAECQRKTLRNNRIIQILAVLFWISVLFSWIASDIFARCMTQVSERNGAAAAKFEVTETGTLMQEISNISIAPGEAIEYEIAVTNKSETAVRYAIYADSRDKNLPLVFRMYKKTGNTEPKQLSDGSVLADKIEVSSDTILADDPKVHNYVLEIVWPVSEDQAERNEDYAGRSETFVVTLKAEQID